MDDDLYDFKNFIEFDDEDDEDIRFSPVPYEIKSSGKLIATVDSETDPFEPDFLIKPFTVGLRLPDRYIDFWGDDCVDQFFAYIDTLEDEYIFYAHNGGKFDFFFFLDYLSENNSPLIMGGRLVKIFFGRHEFRDSFAIIPEALSKYQKEHIDYALFTRDKREANKEAIRHYQMKDCDYLYEQVTYFHEHYGDRLTIASAALATLNSFHGFERIRSDAVDERFRQYYYGGRNQCFETGILEPEPGKRWRMVDRNGMYAAEMKETEHPISSTYELTDRITDRTDFACIVATNRGALPIRAENGSLDFTCKHGIFYATIHEIRAGLETGTLDIHHVKHAWEFEVKATFSEFIDTIEENRQEAKRDGDILRDLFTKRIRNASYGKFALNPRKFKKWLMTTGDIPEPLASQNDPEGWSLHSNSGTMYIWSRPNPRKGGFYNVATAASITGASRANLLRNLSYSERPIYCDTDSIICEEFNGDIDDKRLGGWKIEAEGDLAAIAGKKLYAVFNKGENIKKASKGCSLSPSEIMDVCRGHEIMYRNPVPAFTLANNRTHSLGDIGSASFINRRIKMTGGRK